MVKGKVVKDEDELSKFGLKDGMTIMMMGTAEGKELKEPEKPIKFLEDMTPDEKARALNEALTVVLSPGLENLGNTCYMASTVQMLRRVNELKSALKNLNTQPSQMD
jgi:ubiquitin carboxyl-terminal hydrolase 14